MKSFVNLFKAVLVTKSGKKEASKELLRETIKRGFIFSPDVIFNYSEKELNSMIPEIEKIIGLTPIKLNNTFHK